jgi:hypothetical protein
MWGAVEDGKPHVYFMSSADAIHWSKPQNLTSYDTSRHLLPALTLDPINGSIHIVYYSMRKGDTADVLLASSSDGGMSFTSTQVSQQPFIASTFLGDYISVAAYDGHVYPVWTRSKSNTTTIWAALVNTISEVKDTEQDHFHVFFGLDGTLHFSAEVEQIEIFDVLGRLRYRAEHILKDQPISSLGLDKGLSVARVSSEGSTATLKFAY